MVLHDQPWAAGWEVKQSKPYAQGAGTCRDSPLTLTVTRAKCHSNNLCTADPTGLQLRFSRPDSSS